MGGVFGFFELSLFRHWRTRPHHTNADLSPAMAQIHDRPAVSAALAQRFPSGIGGGLGWRDDP